MQASLEFILGILDERYPAFVCHEDFTGPHARALQLWQRRGFLAREPESHPAASCPHCRDGSPYRLGTKLLCPGCQSAVDPRHLVRSRFDLDAFLSWLAQGLNLKGGVRPVDDRLWHLGCRLLDDRRQECFFRRGATLSALGRERLLARRNAFLISCLPAARLEGFSGHCLSLLDLLRDDKGSLRIADLARVLHGGSDVRFDAGSGTLWAGDDVLGHVLLDSKEYHLLSHLSHHVGEFVAYADLKHYVVKQTGSGDTTDEATFCQRLKSRIKKRVPKIDDLIATTNKGRGYQATAPSPGGERRTVGELREPWEGQTGPALSACRHSFPLTPMTHSQYETSNPYLATYLMCCEARLVSFKRVSRRRFQFRFASDVRLHQLLRLWWSGTPVPMVPTRIFASLQRLRSLVRGSALHATHDCAPPPAASPSPISATEHAQQ